MIERLETLRLILRKARESDLEAVWRNVWRDAAIARWMLWAPTRTLEDARARMARTLAYQARADAFFVCLKADDAPIGFAGVVEREPGVFEETGICVARAHQDRGYGREVLGALLRLAFDLNAGERFVYSCFSDNLPSAALCRALGFRYDRTEPRVREWDGYAYDLDLYCLSRDAYCSARSGPDGARSCGDGCDARSHCP